MPSRRTSKAAEAIREVVSSTILFGLRDPRVKNVTVLRVEVSPNLQSAKVYVSVLGDEKTQALTMHGLNAARGFLQSKVADRIQTRYTPILKFVLDQGVKRSAQATALLKELLTDAAGQPLSGERNPELDALASLTSGGRPGPLQHPPTFGETDEREYNERRHSPSRTLVEQADDLEPDADQDQTFTDDDNHQT